MCYDNKILELVYVILICAQGHFSETSKEVITSQL